jgi:hypothetical protein
MRLTIVPVDGAVTLDGIGYSRLDLSFMDSTIHAVQWYETHGEIEYKDPITGRIVENRAITDISEFTAAIDLWNEAKTKYTNIANNQPSTIGSQSF